MSSLRDQTDVAAEFILVDDGSDAAVWDFVSKLPRSDDRFVVLRRSDALQPGAQSCRNLGLDAARGQYVMFLDSDDLLSSNCLSRRTELLDRRRDAEMLVGRQVMMAEDGTRRWVNVQKREVSDLDRIVAIGHPIDVPWVNGGVTFRTKELCQSGVRWRPEFHWDDVAFHFECLVAGLRASWMEESEPSDFIYRMHSADRYGDVLSTDGGIHSASEMITWMKSALESNGMLTEERRAVIARSLFRACILPAVDRNSIDLTRSIISDAAASGVFSRAEASRVSRYIDGRVATRFSRRATYFWNRFSDRTLVGDYFPNIESTYATISAGHPSDTI